MARHNRSGGTVGSLYRKATKNLAMTGLLVIVVGMAIAYLGSEIGDDSTLSAGGTLAVIGMAVFYLGMDTWYCQNCGQRLGKMKPKQCDRCQSNRIQQRDPGVGEAVRVKRQR